MLVLIEETHSIEELMGTKGKKTNLLFSRGEWHYVTLFYKYNRLETSTTTRINKEANLYFYD